MKTKTYRFLILSYILFSTAASCKNKYELPPVNNTEGEKICSEGYVTGFDAIGSKVLFAIDIKERGDYKLEVSYATIEKQPATASVFISDIKYAQINMEETNDKTDWQILVQDVTLNGGMNFIAIQRDFDDNGLFNLNYIELKK